MRTNEQRAISQEKQLRRALRKEEKKNPKMELLRRAGIANYIGDKR